MDRREAGSPGERVNALPVNYLKMMNSRRHSKYNNRKVEMYGIMFDSKKEADRYCDLLKLRWIGEITDLQLQVPFILVPAYRTEDGRKHKAIVYKADFVYKDQHGNQIVEDCKGYKTPVYKLKKALMLFMHGIEIKET